MTERFKPIGKRIKRNDTLLNIDFKTESDAELCCKLLNQMDKEHFEDIKKLDELTDWHKEHYGCTILEERLEIGYPQKVNETLQKYFNKYTQMAMELRHDKYANGMCHDVTEAIHEIAMDLGVELE